MMNAILHLDVHTLMLFVTITTNVLKTNAILTRDVTIPIFHVMIMILAPTMNVILPLVANLPLNPSMTTMLAL
jgi:hypothetical protein